MAGKHRSRSHQKGKKGSSVSERQSPFPSRTLRSVTNKSSGSPSPQNGFSMVQQAQNTERYIGQRSNAPLRGHAISFVSAGYLVGQEPPSSSQQAQEQEAQAQAQASVEEPTEPVATQVDGPGAEPKVPFLATVAAPLPPAEELEAPEVRSGIKQDQGLEVDSSSGEEEILFHGRAKLSSKPLSSSCTPPTHSTHSTPQQLQSLISSRKASREPSPGPQKSHLSHVLYVSDEEKALVQDYIANMVAEDDDSDDDDSNDNDQPSRRTETFRLYNGAGDENVKVQTKPTLSKSAVSPQVDESADWDSSDLDDFDELATTDEDIDEIGQVLRHRVRLSGAQYLITPVTKGVDDAKWVLHSKLTSSKAAAKIRTYHEVIKMKAEAEEDVMHSSSDEEDNNLDDILDDIESEDAENAAIIARTARMTDEQIARALAKQDELGMDLDQLVLFDGQEGEDGDFIDSFRNNSSFVPFSMTEPISSRTRGKRNQRKRDDFPSAEAFADALDEDPYGGFDVMDFDRPSVRPKRKGKKNDFAFDFDLSDEDLALHIKSQWQKDRDKKASRKREKMDQLEAQLIEAEDRSHPAAIRAEIRRFLVEETDTLELAPMSSHLRAGVHRLAKSLKLDSQSKGREGKGLGRYPVLTKTSYTPRYNIHTVWQVDALMESRKFFPSNKPRPGRGSGPKRGGGVADASFRTGDIVGASAPELGADNKGRAMLEKMGWTSGMGIGADGNKGRLLAIEQVVKRGRTGLG